MNLFHNFAGKHLIGYTTSLICSRLCRMCGHLPCYLGIAAGLQEDQSLSCVPRLDLLSYLQSHGEEVLVPLPVDSSQPAALLEP
jgi:hypothetical protein